jgi:hypothetical protein
MSKSPVYQTPQSDAVPSTATPLYISTDRLKTPNSVQILEKNSPIQAFTPEIRKVHLSTSTSRSTNSSKKSSSSKSISPFQHLQSVNRDEEEIAKLSLAMASMFDDDEDHYQSTSTRNPTVTSANNKDSNEKGHGSTDANGKSNKNKNSADTNANDEKITFEIDESDMSINLTEFNATTPSHNSSASTNTTQSKSPYNGLIDYLLNNEIDNNTKPTNTTLPIATTITGSSSNHATISTSTSQYYLNKELSKREYMDHLIFLQKMSNEILSSNTTVKELQSQLEKFLLLPVHAVQRNVFQQVKPYLVIIHYRCKILLLY